MAEQKTDAKQKKKLALTIITPRGVKFEEEADMLIMRAIDGDLGVLPGHERLSTVLGDGVLRILNNGSESKIAVFGGVAEIHDKSVKIYSTIAQRPEEIDLERAERDRMAAEEAMSEKKDFASLRQVQAMLRRSYIRIEVNLHMEDVGYFDEVDNGDADE
ncbi:MAG: ATP synthase F1 subunit epsilon [Eubacteriales bacterium]|nr:ATP synthase F1 subunit epsilon [Eubacteriales bacterium]MDD4324053.1 ATP synthase F1 subunit epsilon [Eubacteriales bacterium]MDD4541923.1 ATP synthase F1 subunit epsilon [Eubacteriales bacterium]